MSQQPILQTKNICKSFYGVKALKGVDFSLYPGEIVSLIGANGAGKSTLCSIISGIYSQDEGEIRIDGNLEKITSPNVAEKLGIGIVHQEPTLVPRLTVIENIFLNRELTQGPLLLDFKRMKEESVNTLRLLGYEGIGIHRRVQELTLVEKEVVCIAKAMLSRPKILILDEVTAPLNHIEVDHLFKTIRQLRATNIGIIFISHKINETLKIADRVAVLRDGVMVAEMLVSDKLMESDIISHMLGEKVEGDIENVFDGFKTEESPMVLMEVRGLSKQRYYKGISFTLHRGEIVGFAGLKGAGITEMFFSLEGDLQYDSGEILMQGGGINIRTPSDGMRHGIGMVTNDRQGECLALFLSVKDNIIIGALNKLRGKLGMMNESKAEEVTNQYIRALNIKTPGTHTLVQNLSGGNQQKVVIAKWLLNDMNILIVDEPTRGVDVKAKSEIFKLLLQQKQLGKGILVYSPETRELLNICDRLFIVVNGSIVEEIQRNDRCFNEKHILEVIHATRSELSDQI